MTDVADRRLGAGPAGPVRFEVRVRRLSCGSVVAQPVGELDIATVDELGGRLDRELRGCRRLVVDTGRLGFFGACGLNCLLDARDQARTRGCELRLVVNTPEVARVLRVTGCHERFAVYTCVADAVHGG